jgi:hypothetical protein
LVEDATASYFPVFKAATLAMVRAQGGIVGWTAAVAEVLAALEEIKGLVVSRVSPVGPGRRTPL